MNWEGKGLFSFEDRKCFQNKCEPSFCTKIDITRWLGLHLTDICIAKSSYTVTVYTVRNY